MRPKLTESDFVERLKLSSTKVSLLGEYLGRKIKTNFGCDYGHTWLATPKNIMSGTGCPYCGGTAPLTKEIVNERIAHRDLVMIGDYINSGTKALFRCSYGHEWSSIPHNVVRGSGCSVCYPGGLNPNKPACAYVLLFDTFIKYGISTNLPLRLKNHRTRNGDFVLHKTKMFETGHDAIKWENHIKTFIGGKYVSRDICPDGWTETLSLEKLHELELLL